MCKFLSSEQKTVLAHEYHHSRYTCIRSKCHYCNESKSRLSGYVYFLACPDADAVKIGFSKHLDRRVADIQTCNPYLLFLLYSFKSTPFSECMLHFRFRDYRIRGEWFRRVPDIDDYINSLIVYNKNEQRKKDYDISEFFK